ncbi:MAG: diguanylate cyclase [Caulobacteraceae bacterium]|nr:diguanylate cyclase [Caulobacteraceae bacterium]
MALHARVLIVAKDDALAGPLSEGLDRLGWRTITARGPYAALAALGDLEIEVAIIDAIAMGAEEAVTLARRLKASCAPRRLPIIAIGVPDPALEASAFDLVLAPPLHPAQAALRLESLTRMAIAEEEFELRLETFAERGRKLDLPEEPARPFRILAIGEPAPQFLALSNALTSSGAEVVGAFTAYTAFDYLHEQHFDAVVLWAGENQSEALSIAAGMRRNTRLYHVPALLYLQSPAEIGLAEAFHRGVSDLATPEVAPSETAKRVIELARTFRRQNAIREALDKARRSGLMDAPTGLFTRDLFAAHLARLVQSSRLRNRPLSLCVLRVTERAELTMARSGGWLDRAIPQIGSMIGRLIRAEDTAARLGSEVFALALPSTSQSAARAAGERIAAVIACTAFDAGEDRPPFVVEFEIGVAEVEAGENAAKALERAAARALHLKAG